MDQVEGKEVKCFSVNEIPEQISPPVRRIIEEYKQKYDAIITIQ